MKETDNYCQDCLIEDGYEKIVFSFKENGVVVGKATLDLFDDFDVPFYSLTSLRVEDKFRNQRIGTNLLRWVNSFLEEQKMIGVLINIIPEKTDQSKLIHEIYSKNGWQEIIDKGTNVYVFQPKSVENTQVDRIISFLKKNSELELV